MTLPYLLETVNQIYLRTDLPQLNVGDRVTIISKSSNVDKSRLLTFKGIIIAKKNSNNINYTFTSLWELDKIVLSSTFSYHSPLIVSITKLGKIKTRRAKLYYLERKLSKKKDNE